MYLSGTSLVLGDTDDVIHQAEQEALEEWRSDKSGSFEKDDGCQPSEHMKCFLGSIELLLPWSPQVCCQTRDSCISKIQVRDSITDVVIVPFFARINWCRKAACFFEVLIVLQGFIWVANMCILMKNCSFNEEWVAVLSLAIFVWMCLTSGPTGVWVCAI